MKSFTIEVEVKTDSVLHIGTGEGFAGIIDKRTLTHFRNKKRFPIIFGHTVKGIIRDEFRKLSCICEIDNNLESELFGEENEQGKVYFSPWQLADDMVSLFDEVDTSHLFDVKASNQIIRSRRVAKPEHLFTHEIVQNNMIWSGNISGSDDSEQFVNGISDALLLLLLSIKNVKRIGGKRRSGTGACTIEVKSIQIDQKRYTREQVQRLMTSNADRLVRGYSVNG